MSSFKAFDTAAIRKTLRGMVEKGYLTLEHLDEPSSGFKSNLNVRHLEFPSGYHGVRFQNLLRNDQL